MVIEGYYRIALASTLLAITIVLSFRKTTNYYKKWVAAIPAILISGLIYLFWDMRFTSAGIWNYNETELFTGLSIANIPFKRWILLIVLPFFSFYIYEQLKVKLQGIFFDNVFVVVSLLLLVIFGILAYLNSQKLYTFTASLFTAAYLGYTIFRNHFKPYYTSFYLTLVIAAIFYLVYHIGSPLSLKHYHEGHILGIQLFSIPVEDFVWLFLLLLMNTTLYQYFLTRFRIKQNKA